MDLFLAVVVALFGGTILFVFSFFVPTGHDYSQEQTVGVITQRGFPIPFAFSAPGYAWTQFDASAAMTSFIILVAVVFVLFILLRRAVKPKKPSANAMV